MRTALQHHRARLRQAHKAGQAADRQLEQPRRAWITCKRCGLDYLITHADSVCPDCYRRQS